MRTFILMTALFLAAGAAQAAPSTVATTPSSSVPGKGIGVTDSSNLLTGQSLSILFPAGGDWIHTMLAVNKTTGGFEFGLGVIYKFNVYGDRRTGFHVGPGASIGTVAVGSVPSVVTTTTVTVNTGSSSKFAFAIAGLAGGHWTLFDRLLLSVDAGPMLTVVDGNADFSLKPIGNMLGLSAHYLF